MDLGIAGRRAAVAAGSSGLGLASAAALAAEGVEVAICGRDEERLAAAAERIGDACTPIVADVGTPDGAAGFVDAACAAIGPIDILVPNAGGPPPGTFASTDVEAYRTALDLNLMSVVAMCKTAVPPMQERGWGRVIAITSVSVRQPIASLILSNTARAGATAFLKTLALEVFADGVTVNSVQPGLHRTPRVEQVSPADELGTMSMGDPADFGMIVAFLCGEQANFTTGAHLNVDGGTYLGLL
jgi:3-oxoacyl-[acyl-carrier protein] reductase